MNEKPLKRLHDLEAEEVSLVAKGANKRKFMIYKNKEGKMPAHQIRDLVMNTDPSVMERVQECMKAFEPQGEDSVEKAPEPSGLDHHAKIALQAMARIMAPHKDKLPAHLAHKVLDAAGFGIPQEEEEAGANNIGDGTKAPVTMMDEEDDDEEYELSGLEKKFEAVPEKVESEEEDELPLDEEYPGRKYGSVEKDSNFALPEEKKYPIHDLDHAKNALARVAQNGTPEEMKKVQSAVYRKYPALDKEKAEKLGSRMYPDEQMAMKNDKGGNVRKSASPDLKRLDPESRRQVERIFKAHNDLVQRTHSLEKQVSEQAATARKKEVVAKAASFDHLALPQEDIIAQLEIADKMGSFDRVVKNFEALNEQARSGRLFGEIGSNVPGYMGRDSADSAWAKIEAMASGVVQKSATGLTKEQAMDQILKSSEGQRLYAEYKSGRKDGI